MNFIDTLSGVGVLKVAAKRFLREIFEEGGEKALQRASVLKRLKTLVNKVRGEGDDAARAGAGKTVLGKFPDYVNLADDLAARRFSIPTKIWNKMTPAEQWAANRKFLDRMISRGDEIILSNPVKKVSEATGWFGRELNYLVEQGFRLSADGTRMIR